MRIFRVMAWLVAAVVMMLVIGGPGLPATHAEVSLDEVIMRQEQIRPVKAAILKRIDQWEGYAGMRMDPAERTIYVHWKGETPTEALKFLDSQKGRGARIVVEKVQFTQTELMAEATRLVESGAARLAQLAEDLSGLEVILPAGARGLPESRYPVTLLPDSAMPEPMSLEDDAGA